MCSTQEYAHKSAGLIALGKQLYSEAFLVTFNNYT